MNQTLATPVDVRLMNFTANALAWVFVALLLAALVVWVARHPALAIGSIVVTGDVTHNNAVTLRANVAPRLSGNFLSLDMEQARRAFEAVPWVRRALVRREFPDRLQVVLQEHRAVALWGPEGESRLLNSFGEVFEANPGEVDDDALPRLLGADAQAAQVLTMYQSLQPVFEPMDLALEQLELTGRGGWRARLDTGASLELGRGSPAEVLERTQRFLKTITQVSSRYGRRPDALETADLRYQDAYAIRLRGVTTLAERVNK